MVHGERVLQGGRVEHRLHLLLGVGRIRGSLVVQAAERPLLPLENDLLGIGLLDLFVINVVHVHGHVHLEVVLVRQEGRGVWSRPQQVTWLQRYARLTGSQVSRQIVWSIDRSRVERQLRISGNRADLPVFCFAVEQIDQARSFLEFGDLPSPRGAGVWFQIEGVIYGVLDGGSQSSFVLPPGLRLFELYQIVKGPDRGTLKRYLYGVGRRQSLNFLRADEVILTGFLLQGQGVWAVLRDLLAGRLVLARFG